MSWVVHIPKRVKKQIKRLPIRDRERILNALRDFVIDPWLGDIAKIGERDDLWRRRVGNYRIFYSIRTGAGVVEIKEVLRRASNIYQ
ncbi:MAG: type II toxin-antitoxin system RelE/ParE family toxin [Candidatus Sungbacteria bacterium]|nr:type II toxin-antitoxin system RelE/ParE family toxin [Candidatus Sungbacteria bacterium]